MYFKGFTKTSPLEKMADLVADSVPEPKPVLYSLQNSTTEVTGTWICFCLYSVAVTEIHLLFFNPKRNPGPDTKPQLNEPLLNKEIIK